MNEEALPEPEPALPEFSFLAAPPPILYHYTTQQGFLGIIQSREIWATDTQYLNDQREYRHAVALIREELADFRTQIEDPHQSKFLEELAGMLHLDILMNVSVCSFSESGDLLSQWRAYGGESAGVSIGFRGEFLRQVIAPERIALVRCLYEEQEQRAHLRSLLVRLLAVQQQPRRCNDTTLAVSFLHTLAAHAPVMKDPAFAEEREWRILTGSVPWTHRRTGFRAGNSSLVPFYRIALQTADAPFELGRLVIGPTPRPAAARESVLRLLSREGLSQGTEVVNTVVPFRNW